MIGRLSGTLLEKTPPRILVDVNGAGYEVDGPSIALAVLSGMAVADLASAVEAGNAGLMTRVPGIGKKTAERLVLELKGKLLALGGESVVPMSSNANDILSALVALGYSEREAQSAVKTLDADVSVSEGIRLALRVLSR